MDIQEARKLKWDLESEILNLLRDYEKKTHAQVRNISVNISYNIGGTSELTSVDIEVAV